MQEPGLDRHEWETEWAALEPLVVDSPIEALPELERFIEQLMVERGFPISVEEAKEREFEEPEILAEFLEAQRIARLVDRGETVDPGDVGAAISGFRSLYEYLVNQPRIAG
ncbi:MAG: hypothetical protein E6G60_03440 [Actinobacteria bacterium]|nr:MAG: hypothetical protein E6G67_07405 [Actinomycetota bacterium]TMK66344.1 MAG: hypothetical protein E6G60_03440 [Actinomycetota bacterium]